MMHHIVYLISLVFLHLWTISDGDRCLEEPPCYCQGKSVVEIFCKNVTDLNSIKLLILQFPKIYKLQISQSYITSIPSRFFDGRYIIVLAISSPLTNVSDEALSGMKHLRIVNFNGSHFSEVPKGLAISGLTTLQLVHGALSSLEDQLQNMTETTDFLLNNNVISNISPEAFLGTKSVQYLILSHNQLHHLDPKTFEPLAQLKSIDLSNNQLLSVDGCFKMVNPQKINLYGNHLTNIDNAFHHGMWHLYWLNLGDNPQLKLNATALRGSMNYLKVLDLSEIKFSSLDPYLLENFSKLKEIYLNKNDLLSLPVEFFHRSFDLETIELSDNALISIDNLFPNDEQKYSFKYIKLDGNNLSSIASSASFERVQHLDLSRNEIHIIKTNDFENLTSVIHLNLSRNALNIMEKGCFAKQHKLQTLDLSFSNLTTLNGTIQHLPYIVNLTIESSHLESLEENELNALKRIKFINLRNNKLVSVYGAFKNLSSITNLDVSMNNLTTLTQDSFHHFKKKTINLWMAGNPWSCDCRITWILNWLSIKGSILKDEPICESPPFLNGTEIRSLNISDLEVWKENCPESCDCLCVPEGQHIFINVNCSRRNLSQIPVMPSNTVIINLSSNEITRFDGFNSTEHENLRKIDLENNRLVNIKLILPSVTKELKLAGNDLGRFPFGEWNKTSLSLITLSNNSWLCDCDTWDFRNWLISHNNSVLDLDEVRCGKDESISLRNKLIITLSREELCPKHISSVNIVMTTAILAVILVVCLLCYCFGNIVFTILYSCGCRCLKKGQKQRYLHDAFLLFCERDKDFALSVIAKGLESCSPKFNLCIPNRDVQITEETDDVRSILAECNNIIVLLTSEFLDDLQCMHLFKMSMSFSTADSCRRIIIVTNGELPPASKMDNTLTTLMKSCTCLRWGQLLFWEKLRYALPKKQPRTEDYFEDLDEPLIEGSN